jgi:hypothetical protein
VLDLLLLVTIFRLAIVLIRRCYVYNVTVFSYVVYNVDFWCWVVVGYVECVAVYVVFIQAYAVTSDLITCQITTRKLTYI